MFANNIRVQIQLWAGEMTLFRHACCCLGPGDDRAGRRVPARTHYIVCSLVDMYYQPPHTKQGGGPMLSLRKRGSCSRRSEGPASDGRSTQSGCWMWPKDTGARHLICDQQSGSCAGWRYGKSSGGSTRSSGLTVAGLVLGVERCERLWKVVPSDARDAEVRGETNVEEYIGVAVLTESG